MRKLWAIALSAIILTGMAGAQGINDGLKNPDSNAKNPGGKMSETITDFKKTGNSGPGFVQEDFVNNLGGNINETFGEKKGEIIFKLVKIRRHWLTRQGGFLRKAGQMLYLCVSLHLA